MEKLRIFAASPSDVEDERGRLPDIVQELSEILGLDVEVVDWCKVVPGLGRPEQVILDQLEPATWDVFIGILWHRFGTPTQGLDPQSKRPYLSGTEEEFQLACRCAQKFGRPRVMIYRCERPVTLNDVDGSQIERVKEFFRQCSPDGSHPALCKTYDTVYSFEKQVRRDLGILFKEHLSKAGSEGESKGQLRPEQRGPVSQPTLPMVAPEVVRKAAARARKKPVRSAINVQELMKIYEFPKTLDGSGQCIGMVELGGGYLQTDLQAYFRTAKLPVPHVVPVSVDGGRNAPSRDQAGLDSVVTLDIEFCGCIAPRATLVPYFAPNTNDGFLHAIQAAVDDEVYKPSVLSINWGAPESTWTSTVLKDMNRALEAAAKRGITVCCASGDGGATDSSKPDEPGVDFPASSPHVLAVGGTRLKLSQDAIVEETVWNDGEHGGATGGGVSAVFPLPEWQSGVRVLPRSSAKGRFGRLVPDVGAHASPLIGYTAFVHGAWVIMGGTTAASNVWAGLVALINQATGSRIGCFTSALYNTLGPAGVLREITKGNNSRANCPGYKAGPGWNACTGWGSPNGRDLVTAFKTLGRSRK